MSNPQTNNAWWQRRWQTLLQQLGLDAGGPDGLRGCRVKRMEVMPGSIQAQVQDRELGASTVEIRLPVLDDAQWERVIDALGSQAIYAAQLLAGNMPPEIEQLFAQAGAHLLPSARDEIEQQCSSCPPGAVLCRPLAAVYAQLGEMLAEDPWLLLRLRGRDRHQVLASIHERRNLGAETAARPAAPATQAGADVTPGFYTPAAGGVRAADDSAPPLEEQLGDFWGRRKVLEEVHHRLARPVVELALLRRLGAPTPTPDGQDAYSQLQAVYRRVTERAWGVAFASEAEPPAASPDDAQEASADDTDDTDEMDSLTLAE